MTHSTRGGGRAKAPDMAGDKAKQHKVVDAGPSEGASTGEPAQATAYRGSGPGTHGGGGGGTPSREHAPSAKGSSNRGKGSGTLGH